MGFFVRVKVWNGRQHIVLVSERDLGVGICHVQEPITRRFQKVGEVPLRKRSQGVRSLGLSSSRDFMRFLTSATLPGLGVSPDPTLIGAKNHHQQASDGPSELSNPWFDNSPGV